MTMADPISFDPYLGWVNITDPNNVPEDARTITAEDLLRYENLGQDVAEWTAGESSFLGRIQAAKIPDSLITGTIVRNGADQIVSAEVVWPDDSPGTLTITSRDATGAVLAYNITYGSPVTQTFTQPTITRNANGAATNVPQIVVS
jgi:hypothetical protein